MLFCLWSLEVLVHVGCNQSSTRPHSYSPPSSKILSETVAIDWQGFSHGEHSYLNFVEFHYHENLQGHKLFCTDYEISKSYKLKRFKFQTIIYEVVRVAFNYLYNV